MSLPGPAPADQQPTAAEHLPDDPATLKRMVMELLASLHERDRDIEALRHRLDLLLRRLYGPRGERFDPCQLLLFAEPAAGQDGDPGDTSYHRGAWLNPGRCWPRARDAVASKS